MLCKVFSWNVPSWWKHRAENVILVTMTVLHTTLKLGGSSFMCFTHQSVVWVGSGGGHLPFLLCQLQGLPRAPRLGRCKRLSASPGGIPDFLPLHHLSTWSTHHQGVLTHLLSHVQHFVTPWPGMLQSMESQSWTQLSDWTELMDCSTPGSPVLHHLLEFA